MAEQLALRAKNAGFTCGGFSDSDIAETGDVFDFDESKPSSPEVELFLAVIARVWADAWVDSNVSIRNTDRRCEPDMVRASARRWLLLDFGDFKRDREDICDNAGLDPDAVRKAAIRRNKLARVQDQERDRRERESIDRIFEHLAARASDLTRGQVGSSLGALARRELALAV